MTRTFLPVCEVRVKERFGDVGSLGVIWILEYGY